MLFRSLLLVGSLLIPTLASASPVTERAAEQLFADPAIDIPQADPNFKLTLSHHVRKFVPHSSSASALAKRNGHTPRKPRRGKQTVNTIFSGVYPSLNLTLLTEHGPQDFISLLDTGSASTFVVGSNFTCLDLQTKDPVDQSACGFGAPLYTPDSKFKPLPELIFNTTYFPESNTLEGPYGLQDVQLGGITVPKQYVAVIQNAAYEGDGQVSSILGLAFPRDTNAFNTTSGSYQQYDPIFTSMVKLNLLKSPVFTLAFNRGPRGTPVSANAGQIAFGGLVDKKYYEPPFATVPIEISKEATDALTYYTTTHDFIYGKNAPSSAAASAATKGWSSKAGGGSANHTLKTLRFTSIIDSGTAPSFIPTKAANELNSLFEPSAIYNETLGYWTVDCNAKAPYAAFKIGGTVFPVDPRDMIVPGLNALPGYENVCFSAFADGGEDGPTVDFLIGSTWLRSVVLVHDIGRTQMHIARRRPY